MHITQTEYSIKRKIKLSNLLIFTFHFQPLLGNICSEKIHILKIYIIPQLHCGNHHHCKVCSNSGPIFQSDADCS